MKWKIALIVTVVLGFPIAFTAGVVLSLDIAADNNPAETLRTLAGSVGDWVSGLGSLAAAAVAVYLADNQRRNNVPKIDVDQYYSESGLVIDLTSCGEKDAVVRGVYIRDTVKKKQILISRPPFVDPKDIPRRFGYGDVQRITLPRTMFIGIQRDLVAEFSETDFSNLTLVVGTSTYEFREPLNAEFVAVIRKSLYPTM
ncbi:hypothetical protein HKK55_14780 [Pseudomonas sp. ADAK18]|uniref:hypothetical protein n=1 Tax=Pseudomonas sp. ADAK18 TaxID=2730848 RepID=UPI00146292CA|nr:hypothetical protein [Pseudomonas sp. ADAK18]QJI29918.1 hypothetical protein HKK55_14780 [Pseudomonas sp. ADAK18]